MDEASELERLRRLLRERIDSPEREGEIDAAIRGEFERRRAVMVLDMVGFTRTVIRRGIIHYLAMIEQMAHVALPLIAEHGGRVVKREADNLIVVFDDVVNAVRVSQRIMAAMEDLDRYLPEDRDIFVGVGIGWGDLLVLGDEELFGSELNLASKLGEDLAQRDILLTEAAREQLPPDFSCRELRFAISGLDLVAYRVEHSH